MADNSSDFSNNKIAIRNNWLKIFVVVVVTGVIAVKLWQADFSQVFSGFDFSDLLSLFLALFSIALAVLFYLKATETSNVFYDNTYRFTKDVSEILGRVEAGFGERLKHLDEGYTGLKSVVERIPFDRERAQKEIEEEEQQLERVERERDELIENLAKKAQLEEAEKVKLFERLKEQDKELSIARKELDILRIKMKNAALEEDVQQIRFPTMRIERILKAVASKLDDEFLYSTPKRLNRHFIGDIAPLLTSNELSLLREFKILDLENKFTERGIDLLRSML